MPTYAIAQTGGKQYKVAPGDIVKVEKLDTECGTQITLPVVLVVDGATVITQPDQLASHHVCAEVIDQIKGPKIRIHKFKNKTGYHKRQGHRQQLTVLKIITIS